MACALRLSQLIDSTTPRTPTRRSRKENIYVLEKSARDRTALPLRRLLDPRSMRELLPGFEKEAPIEAEVTRSCLLLTENGKLKLPITPPPLRDHGNYVISINIS